MYDFDTIINRVGTNCQKWDFSKNKYPMWVADMDFKAAPAITKAIGKRLEHDVYGYSLIPDELYEAYISWWDRRYNLKMEKNELLFAMGVMPAITSIIRKFSDEKDKILIQTPVYHVFFYVIENNDREVLENELIYENGEYHIDFEDLDEKLSRDDTKIMLLCNPHNPIGKIWEREDLERIGKLAKKHGVILVSDEIHCDLTDPGKTYVPFASINDEDMVNNSLTCIAPSKTFNIAGLQSSMIFTKNEEFYQKTKKQLVADFSSSPNSFAIDPVIAAYNEGEEWLEELREYLYKNKEIVSKFLKTEIPDIHLVAEDATYLLWLDCSKLNTPSRELACFLKDEVSLFLSPGDQFGQNGDNFLRMNIACPQKLLKEGLDALKEGISLLKENK